MCGNLGNSSSDNLYMLTDLSYQQTQTFPISEFYNVMFQTYLFDDEDLFYLVSCWVFVLVSICNSI